MVPMSEIFQPEPLVASLRPLASAAPLSAAELAYRQFYGFVPREAVESRLGWFEAVSYTHLTLPTKRIV